MQLVKKESKRERTEERKKKRERKKVRKKEGKKERNRERKKEGEKGRSFHRFSSAALGRISDVNTWLVRKRIRDGNIVFKDVWTGSVYCLKFKPEDI